MAETATLARPYAEAVFRLADAGGALAAWSGTLDALAQVVAHPDMQECLAKYDLSAPQLQELFLSLCPDDFSAEAKTFVGLLIEYDRLTLLPEIFGQFEALKNEREGVVDARITSAFALEGAQLASLVGDLEKRFKRKINPEVSIDPGLIGGVRVIVGDEVIDGSVRGKLDAMAAGLLAS
ncbi:MAG: F0F1 ATP synthase subunit delta [Betaproteobacteria bacterium]|nr:MAG: F0F1 ATP synthase subunit delta [Betaproteobacteria bacterium]